MECDQDLGELAPFYDWSSDHFYIGQSIAIDMEALIKYLNILIENEPLRIEMGEQARRHGLEKYSWRRSVEMMLSLWQELSMIAEKLPPPSPGGESGYLRPQYFKDFQCFATQTYDSKISLALTERGRNVASGKEPLFLLEEPRKLLQSDLMIIILCYIRMTSWLKGYVTFGEIESLIARKRRLDPSVARRHLLWLMKYNLLRRPV